MIYGLHSETDTIAVLEALLSAASHHTTPKAMEIQKRCTSLLEAIHGCGCNTNRCYPQSDRRSRYCDYCGRITVIN